MSKGTRKFDAIVIGGGAAGLSAALWCDELKLSCLLLEKEAEFGGQLLRVYNRIENHLGIEAENGREMRDRFVRQTENRVFTRRLQTNVSRIDTENKEITLPNGEQLSAKTLIIATGVKRRKLNVEGEDFFRGKGIIESGKKDAAAIFGKNALIVGGGDAALENALILAETAKKVYIAHRRKEFRGRTEFVEKILRHPKIKIFTESAVRRISGNELIETVEIQNLKNGELQALPVEAVLIRIGVEPITEMLGGQVELDGGGYIKINSNCETSVKGVFAVGDLANPLAPTVSSAVGMGATAAKSISALLSS
jgi:thioredoxin reductase (NADPH)